MNLVMIVVSCLIGLFFGAVFWNGAGVVFSGLLGALIAAMVQLARRTQYLESQLLELKRLYSKSSDANFATNNVATNNSVSSNRAPITPTDISSPVSATTIVSSAIKPTAITQKVEEPAKPAEPVRKPVVPPDAWPPRSSEPNLIEKLFIRVKNFFTQGNPIVRIGIVVMFFGVAFLIKLASSQGLLPIEFRLAGVLICASALIVFGWRTRLRIGGYGLVLQGGGIALIYLTLFAAAKMYSLMPLTIAFGLLFVVVVFGVLLSLLQNAQVLAILATAGGFLAPILTSNGSGNYVGLFSFYLILNLGILGVAVYKTWRMLNWIGFIFTFVITTTWGVMQYAPENYSTTQPFLIAFFALYLAVSILFSFKQPTNLKGLVDGSLTFGLPLVAFGLQTLLLHETQYGLAISAVVLAVIYLVLAFALLKKASNTHQLLIQSFIALGVSFVTLAIPLALNASWTAVSWALEASGLVWIGIRQMRLRTRVVGYLLHFAAGFSMAIYHGVHTGDIPIIRGDFIAVLLLSLSAFVIAYLVEVLSKKISTDINSMRSFEVWMSPIALVIGFIWWFTAGVSELFVHTPADQHFASYITYAALTAIVATLLSRQWQWRNLGFSPYALLPYIMFISAAGFSIPDDYAHPLHGFGALALILFLVVQYRFLFIMEQSANKSQHGMQMISFYHVFTAWLIFAWIFWEVSWQKEYFQWKGTSAIIMWFAALMIPVMGLIAVARKRVWPFVSFENIYKNWVPLPLFFFGGLWFFLVCLKTLKASENYLPILNPLDLAQFGMLLIFAYSVRRNFFNQLTFLTPISRYALLGLMFFVWLNVVCLRAVSRLEHITYNPSVLWNAPQIQMTLSILWTLCALVIMNASRRLKIRALWIVGASLLGLVLIKLIFKQLSGPLTLESVISFIVVGILMLVIGYLSPIPTKKTQTAEETSL